MGSNKKVVRSERRGFSAEFKAEAVRLLAERLVRRRRKSVGSWMCARTSSACGHASATRRAVRGQT